MGANGWGNFWKDQRQSFLAAMQIATGFFARQIHKRYQLQPADEIFDYGCGPGFVADVLAAQNITLTGADINEFYIAQCRQHHPRSTFFNITTEVTANTQILARELQTKQFDTIIILSVAQYLKDTKELEQVLQMLQRYMKPQGRIILADIIDEKTSSVKDALSLLWYYVRIGKVPTFIRFMSYLFLSDYRKISGKMPLLLVPEAAIQTIAAGNGLAYEKVKGLTVQPTRCSYVFTRQA